ncbi:SUR7/PalI family domain-containing protein [Paramyrothecium foliicola]|nr:SUR7/PalI family domain-containing protein [Paramyrothecium foliicola]
MTSARQLDATVANAYRTAQRSHYLLSTIIMDSICASASVCFSGRSRIRLKKPDAGFLGSLLALIAAVLAIVTLLTGLRPDDLQLFKVDVENFRVPSKLSSSHLLADIESVSGGDLTGSELTAENLGLSKYYTIHVLTYCSHSDQGGKSCSSPKVGWWFDPIAILKLDEAGLSGKLSDGFNSALKSYKEAATFIGIGFIIASITIVLAFILSIVARRQNRLAIIAATSASIGSAFLLADGLIARKATGKVVNGIENDLEVVGVSATIGLLVYLPFVGAVLSMIAAITFSLIAYNNRAAGANKYPGMPRKGSVIVGQPTGPIDEARGFSKGQSLLQRVSTWSRGSYVQIEKQNSNVRVMERPIPEDSTFLDPADEVRYHQSGAYRDQPAPEQKMSLPDHGFDFRNPSERNANDIAMQPMPRRDRSPNAAYEPYSNIH